MARLSSLLLAFVLLFLQGVATPARAQDTGLAPVTVFAAASLRGALEEIAADYPAPVTLSFGGSGTLARQAAAGAPVDAVVLAHRDWASWLDARGLLLPGTMREVAGGTLVLIGPVGAPPLPAPDAARLSEALGAGRLAMGQRDGVPAGIYGREWLTHIGAWEALAPHLAETDNVRAALALVAQGAAPLGIVYASDALAEPRVSIRYTVPGDAHTPIRYPAAALTAAGIPFVERLAGPDAAAVFARHGFAP